MTHEYILVHVSELKYGENSPPPTPPPLAQSPIWEDEGKSGGGADLNDMNRSCDPDSHIKDSFPAKNWDMFMTTGENWSKYGTEAEFWDQIQTKVLRVYFLVIHSHICGFAWDFYFFKLTQPLTVSVNEKGGKTHR